MSLADAMRIKNLEGEVATLVRRIDALEQYMTELPEPWVVVSDPPEPKRGPGRPRKDASMKARAKIGDAHFE